MESASTIGRGTVVRGSVHGDGDLEILGHVEGSVSVTGELAIGELARVKSDVSGRRVTVQGTVAGNVSATEAIVLLAGARVVGDLAAPQIGIRPGALVRGMVSTGATSASGASAGAHARPAASRGTPQRPAPQVARAPARPVASAPARPVSSPPARPVTMGETPKPPARVEATTMASPRVEPRAHVEPSVDEAAGAESHDHADRAEHVAHIGAAHGGAPPPVVPQIRKGAKASLRRKGPR